jgi:signal transduction histidine kinase
VNPAAEQMLDVRENRVLGVRVGKLIRGRDRAGNEFDSRFGSSTTEAWSASGFLDHDTWPVAIAAAPIRDDAARLVGAVYALRDMRREHEVERMKTEFLSNISHELRTPLTPIKGYAEMLRLRRVPPGRARAFLDGILDASERLERIIDILVNFAALEAGRLVLRTEDVDVASVVHGLSERWQSRTPHHQVEEKVSSRMPRVVADRRLLERSIDELIDNAVKYSPEGGRIVVGVKVSANGSGRALTITVTDQGLGIEPDDVPKIFADFQQLDGSATRRFGGLGLGLPFVQRVVEAHRGHITVDSEPGTGSVFMITLPIEGPATRARSNA